MNLKHFVSLNSPKSAKGCRLTLCCLQVLQEAEGEEEAEWGQFDLLAKTCPNGHDVQLLKESPHCDGWLGGSSVVWFQVELSQLPKMHGPSQNMIQWSNIIEKEEGEGRTKQTERDNCRCQQTLTTLTADDSGLLAWSSRLENSIYHCHAGRQRKRHGRAVPVDQGSDSDATALASNAGSWHGGNPEAANSENVGGRSFPGPCVTVSVDVSPALAWPGNYCQWWIEVWPRALGSTPPSCTLVYCISLCVCGQCGCRCCHLPAKVSLSISKFPDTPWYRVWFQTSVHSPCFVHDIIGFIAMRWLLCDYIVSCHGTHDIICSIMS